MYFVYRETISSYFTLKILKNKDDLKKILEKLVEATEKKEGQQNLKHIAEKFILEKFTRKIQMQHNGLKFVKKSVYDST